MIGRKNVHKQAHLNCDPIFSYSIVQMINTVHSEKEKAKRSGEPEPDAAYSLDAFGNQYNLRLKRNTDLVAPNAKLVIKDGNHTYTERVTNSSYPVEWLLAEESTCTWCIDAEDYEDYEGSGEDNSAMTECDNFIVRSSVSFYIISFDHLLLFTHLVCRDICCVF